MLLSILRKAFAWLYLYIFFSLLSHLVVLLDFFRTMTAFGRLEVASFGGGAS